MATSRPFAYNPIPPGSEISGTTQFVDLAIGVLDEQYDADYGGVKWWEGPDEDLGYIICQPIPPNTQPTPISGLTASVGFYRTIAFTDSAFLNLCNALPARKNQTKFQTTNEAIVWLTANGYWTNYIAPTPTPTATVTSTPTSTISITSTPTTTPTNTPTTTSNRYYYTVGIVDESCTVTSSFIGYSTVSYPIFNFYNDGATKYFISSASYSPTAILLNSLSSSFCIPAVTPTPTPTSTSSVPVTPTTTSTATPTPTGTSSVPVTPTETPTPTPTPSSPYTLTLSSCTTGNAYYVLGGSFVSGDIVEVKATFGGTGTAGVNNSNATLFLGTTGNITGSTCFTPTTFMSWNLSLTGTLTFGSGGNTVYVRSLAENAAAASVNASTSLEITKINGITVTGLSAVGCWDYSTGSPCTP